MDQELHALLRLLHATPEHPSGTPDRRRYVAEQAGVNAQNLYQVARGVRLPSGRVRRLGRDVKDALSSAFPGWLQAASDEPSASSAASVVTDAPAVNGGWPHRRFPESYWQSLSNDEQALIEAEMLKTYDRLMAERERLRHARVPPRKVLKPAA